MEFNKVLVVYTIPRTYTQKKSLDFVKKILQKYELNFTLANRDKLKASQFLNKDLIIAVGGDGTFLRAAQFSNESIMLGVNADPKNKEGFFMKCHSKSFERVLKKLLYNKIKTRKLPRLEARISGKKIGSFAVNEFFIGPRKAYQASKYIIKVDKHKERHKSSGIIVATPAGSYAWASASHGKKMHLDSKNFQYVVREPYMGKIFRDYKLRRGILKKGRKITVISEMLDGIVVADSVSKEYSLKHGQKVEVKMSEKPVEVVWT